MRSRGHRGELPQRAVIVWRHAPNRSSRKCPWAVPVHARSTPGTNAPRKRTCRAPRLRSTPASARQMLYGIVTSFPATKRARRASPPRAARWGRNAPLQRAAVSKILAHRRRRIAAIQRRRAAFRSKGAPANFSAIDGNVAFLPSGAGSARPGIGSPCERCRTSAAQASTRRGVRQPLVVTFEAE